MLEIKIYCSRYLGFSSHNYTDRQGIHLLNHNSEWNEYRLQLHVRPVVVVCVPVGDVDLRHSREPPSQHGQDVLVVLLLPGLDTSLVTLHVAGGDCAPVTGRQYSYLLNMTWDWEKKNDKKY